MAVVGFTTDSVVELEGAISETNAVAVELKTGSAVEFGVAVAVKGASVVEVCAGSADTAADWETVVAAMGLEGGGGAACVGTVDTEADFGSGVVDANLFFVPSGFFSDNFCTLLITFCALSSGVCFTFLASLAFWRLSLSIALCCSISC